MQGQMASSTSMELAACVVAMVRNAPLHMAIDSESMRQQTVRLTEEAQTWTNDNIEQWWLTGRPFKQPCGLQADGDHWEFAWQAVLERRPDAQIISKVKGHATQQHSDRGIATVEEKEGNDWVDTYAGRDAGQHEPVAVQLAHWMQRTHAGHVKLIGGVHIMIAVVAFAERTERERRQKIRNYLQGHDSSKEAKVSCKLPKHEDASRAEQFKDCINSDAIHS